jgi:hypothetical protein
MVHADAPLRGLNPRTCAGFSACTHEAVNTRVNSLTNADGERFARPEARPSDFRARPWAAPAARLPAPRTHLGLDGGTRRRQRDEVGPGESAYLFAPLCDASRVQGKPVAPGVRLVTSVCEVTLIVLAENRTRLIPTSLTRTGLPAGSLLSI